MPTYSYLCETCNHEFDRILKIADRDQPCEQECSSCGARTIIKKVAAVATSYTITPTSAHSTGKVSDAFKDTLQRIHERTPGSQLHKTSKYVR